MNTILAVTKRLVCLLLAFGWVSQGKAEGLYDLKVEDFRVSAEKPDHRDPFLSGTDATTGTRIADPNCYLTDPLAQIGTDQCFYVSLRLRAYVRNSQVVASIDRPNFTSAIIACTGRKYNAAGQLIQFSGAFNADFSQAVYTSPDEPYPNPATGGMWIYGLDEDGSLVTTPGTKIGFTESEGAILMDSGEGDFLINPNANLKVSELWIVGAKVSYSQSFVNMYNNARVFWSIGIPSEIMVEVMGRVTCESKLNAVHGCRGTPQYPEHWRFPAVFCGNQDGPVKPSIQFGRGVYDPIVGDTRDQLTLSNRMLGNWSIETSTNLTVWEKLTGYSIPTTDYFGDRRHMTIRLPLETSGSLGDSRFYRLRSSDPSRPPIILSSPPGP